MASLCDGHELAPFPWAGVVFDAFLENVSICLSGLGMGGFQLYSDHVKMIRYEDVVER